MKFILEFYQRRSEAVRSDQSGFPRSTQQTRASRGRKSQCVTQWECVVFPPPTPNAPPRPRTRPLSCCWRRISTLHTCFLQGEWDGTAAPPSVTFPRNLLRSCYFHEPRATLRGAFPRRWERTGAFAAWVSPISSM